MGFGGELLAHLRAVIRTMGMGDGRESLGALAHARPPPPAQVGRGPPRGGIDGGRRAQATTEQARARGGSACVVCGVAPRAGRHGEGMPPDPGHPFLSPEGGEPVPGDQAVDGDAQVGPRGRHAPATRLRAGVQVPRPPELAVLGEEADIQGPGVHIDATVKWRGLGVEAPEGSSSPGECVPLLRIPWWYAEEGASISIIAQEPTASQRPLVPRCAPQQLIPYPRRIGRGFGGDPQG
jgi:hypothetical protein